MVFAGIAPTPASAQQRGTAVELEAIVENPSQFVGRAVTVEGEIDDILSPSVFRMDNGDWFDTDLLVVTAVTPGMMEFFWTEDDDIRVTGTVHVFRREKFERDPDILLGEQSYALWEGRPVLVANMIASLRSLGEITDDPYAFLGRTVSVRGEVDDVLGPRAFTLSTGGWFARDILVVSDEGLGRLDASLTSDSEVQVTGPVRLFSRVAFERDFGVDLDDRAFADWEGRPAIFARSLQTVAETD
jgi:hypothetical protein